MHKILSGPYSIFICMINLIAMEHVIPLFTKHYLQSGKVNDFLDFSLAFLKISDKAHQTEKGKLELIELKSRMNYKRLY